MQHIVHTFQEFFFLRAVEGKSLLVCPLAIDIRVTVF